MRTRMYGGVRGRKTKVGGKPTLFSSYSICGDGRTRTAVQTPHQAAFYMFSLALVFDQGLPSDGLPGAYPLGLGEA